MRYLSILTFLFSIAVINPAHAGVLIELDLSVTNQLTLTATTETAIGTVSGPTSNGIVLQGTGNVDSNLVGGTSDTFGFKSTGAFNEIKTSRLLDSGVYSLNLYESGASVSTSITSGEQAFVGTTTMPLDATSYNNLLNGPSSGKIYAFDDGATTFATNGTYIGDWAKASSGNVPEPSTAIAMGLLGVLGFAGKRRRRLGVANA